MLETWMKADEGFLLLQLRSLTTSSTSFYGWLECVLMMDEAVMLTTTGDRELSGLCVPSLSLEREESAVSGK